ncbi:MAG: tRNA (adenosine(37)-N6)-dimethylallyltransferase MiaA [Prevotella sp.]|nr:tRNA (adenosine(37)-N6)-dimethylallyltransferase MiaA [Prevotella sp.]
MNLIVITGPTGVGKTELCLKIAEHYGTDIINADSRQIYAEIPIGTAAPTTRQMQQVRHHFVGTRHIGEYYSASMFEQEVLALISQMASNNKKLALLSGGSMMYIDAVCNGIDDIPTIHDDIREMMKQRLQTEGLQALVAELKTLDPQHWAIVDKSNPRRVVHALEICHQTGKTYTSFRIGKKKSRPFNIIKIGLTRDKVLRVKRGQVIMDHSELYERINQRVINMIDEGLIDEARRMLPFRSEKALNTIGYKELFQHFDGDISLDEATRQIQSNSREYARKQLTWFKKDDSIKWFHPEQTDEIINYIDTNIQNITT